MKILLKIMFAPVIAVLALVIWLCGLALSLSAWIFGILGTIFGILGLAILLLDSVTTLNVPAKRQVLFVAAIALTS